jgi:NhaP-type Na+/H+ and K+/H+ antiporter
MQTEYLTLIILGALLILSPFVKSMMERIGIPALVGQIARCKLHLLDGIGGVK